MLESGQTITEHLRPAAPFAAGFRAYANQFVRIAVDPADISLTVTILDPNNTEVLRVEAIGGAYGVQRFGLLIPHDGRFTVRVDPWEAADGAFTIALELQRPAEEHDRNWIAAQNSFFAGVRNLGQGTADGLRSAAQGFEDALSRWRSMNDARGEALALSWSGRSKIFENKPGEAVKTLDEAARLWRMIGDRRAEGQVVSSGADAQSVFGAPASALEQYERALAIRSETGDRRGEAETLSGMANVYGLRGDPAKAIQLYRKAADTRWVLGDRTGQASSIANLTNILTLQGENRAAAEELERVLALLPSLHNPRLELAVLTNLSRVYGLLSEFQKAIDFSLRALSAAKVAGDRRVEGVLLNNSAILYQNIGEYRRAQDYLRESLKLRREMEDRRGEGIVLSNLGYLATSTGQYDDAIANLQASLPLIQSSGDRHTEGVVLNNIGSVYCELKQFGKALEFYQQSLTIRASMYDRWGEAYARNGFGRAYMGLGKYFESAEEYQKALAIAREIGDRNSEVGALEGLARVKTAEGRLVDALVLIESALHLIETTRAELVLPDLRTSYFAQYRDHYGLAIDILMALHKQHPTSGYASHALAVNERAQARTLVELLREAGAGIRKGIPPELLTRERATRELLNAKIEQRLRLQSGKSDTNAIAALNKEIDRLSSEHQRAESEIRSASPEYTALTQPVALTAEDIRRAIPDDTTAIVEFSLGAEQSFGWFVTRTAIRSFELPSGKKIEQLARAFYNSVSARKSSRALAEESGRQLGVVLFGPIASAIRGKKLVIVPSGILYYIPFDAVGDPGAPAKTYVPLVARHVISTLPSASAIPVLRGENRKHARTEGLVAVFADPVFETSDPRVAHGAKPLPQAISRGSSEESAVDKENERAVLPVSLTRLAFSRDEANAIHRLFPGKQSREILDFSANLNSVKSPEMKEYRMLHLATHGLLDSAHPERSALVLSLVDKSGNHQPGLLKMADIFNLILPTDLVVLSACETALGTVIKGEGLVGLTRAFMYAGANRVMASLWNVDDLATAELMKGFYQGLLRGQSPAVALRAAKQAIMKKPAWSSPYFWAAFTLQGEFRDESLVTARK